MKNERLLEAVGKIDEELIAEAAPGNKKWKNAASWRRWLVAAACVCVVAGGAWSTLNRLDYDFGAGCSAYPGKIVDGIYYYYIPHEGVMRYTPEGESERLLHTYWFEEWDVNEYGIYYWQDMSVYVRDHETGTQTKLYTANFIDNTHIRFTLTENDDIIVTHFNKNTEVVYELLIDGVSGKVLETVMENISYDEARIVYYSDIHYSVGDRQIVLEPTDSVRDKFFVTENGKNILPDGLYVTNYIEGYFGDVLCLNVWDGVTLYDGVMQNLLMIYPDGTNKVITVPEERYEGGTAEFLFYASVADGTVGCVDTSTGEAWLLEADTECDILDLEANGEYVYTCAPWAEETACWKLVYSEEGKPVGISMIDSDIRTKE